MGLHLTFVDDRCLLIHGRCSQRQSDSTAENRSSADQDALFEISVGLSASASPTTYERTTIGIGLDNTSLPVELVDLVDETRGIQAKSIGRVTRLDQLFGPKNGLTDHMTIRAVVRVRGQSGEKIVRKTVWF